MPSGHNRVRGLQYNERMHKRIIKAVSLGATMDLASKAGGISARTFRAWMADAKRNGEKSPFHQLHQDFIQADGMAGVHALGCIEKAAKEGKWQAAAWILERKHGYRRDGVKEPHTTAAIPGSLDSHEAEILTEVRRLRQSATQGGSHVAAANLLRMEADLVQSKRAEERAEADRSHQNADQGELLQIIKNATEGMPRAVLDELYTIISEKRRRAS